MIRHEPAPAYHATPGLSSSVLRACIRDAAAWRWGRDQERKETTQMLLGTLVHSMVLEPDTLDQHYCVGTTKADARKAGMRRLIDPAVWARAEIVADAARGWWCDGVIMAELVEAGQTEQSVYWDRGDIPCKARPDLVATAWGGKWLIDLKTCRDLSRFRFDARDWLYPVQLEWYRQGLEANGLEVDCLGLLAVQTEGVPHATLFKVETGPKELTAIDDGVDAYTQWRTLDPQPVYRMEVL